MPEFRKPPSVEELKAGVPVERQSDRVPGADRDKSKKKAAEPAEPLPPFRAGPIAKGVNRLYLRAGKVMRVFDPVLGAALIECTRKELDEDGEPVEGDLTVGEAWEELARTNPRIRGILLQFISGGAKVQLLMAHAPFLLALMMKPGVMNRIPFHRFIESWFADDGQDDGAPAAGPFDGLTEQDAAQMMAMAQQWAGQMMGGPRNAQTGRMPDFPMPTP